MTELFDIAHDQEVYAFKGRNNLGLFPEITYSEKAILQAWEAGFGAGWNQSIEAVRVVAIGEQVDIDD